MKFIKKVGLGLMVIFYMIAGINHFYNPVSYRHIIPAYIPCPHTVNIAAGACEIAGSLLLIFLKTRKIAAWGIICMLVAFLPVHVDMVIRAPFLLGGDLMVTPLIAWIRLIVLQPLLIAWACWYTRDV